MRWRFAPAGQWCDRSHAAQRRHEDLNRAFKVATLILDLMQTLPTFVYLAPLTLFFAIGPAAATIATLIYAAPPVVRLTAHAIRSVPAEMLDQRVERLGHVAVAQVPR